MTSLERISQIMREDLGGGRMEFLEDELFYKRIGEPPSWWYVMFVVRPYHIWRRWVCRN